MFGLLCGTATGARYPPSSAPIHDVAGDELAPIIPKLDALARELGCPVEEEPMSDGCHGYYEIDSGRIAIDASLSANGKVKTRCHEIAHALIRRERQEGDLELDRASEELVVESVAFTCVGALGIKTDGYSVPYLASWAEQSDLSPRRGHPCMEDPRVLAIYRWTTIGAKSALRGT